jgi:peptide/nickel transport system permease protein
VIRYLLRRILYAAPILFGVVLVTFVLFYVFVSPTEMARRQLGKNPTPAQIQGWLGQHGYNRPLAAQFGSNLEELLLLRFGTSDVDGEPIAAKIRRGAGPSAQIAGLILLGGLLASVSAALAVAYYRGTYIDYAATFVAVLLMSVVYMIWIVVGQYVFGKVLKLSPLTGYRGGWLSYKFVLLPVLIGILQGLGRSIRFYRTVMLDEMGQDYVRTARAKGVGERAILFRHVLKNALVPIVTSTVLSIPFVILGNLLLESFFGIPGLGGITIDAINTQDFAVVRAMVFLGALLYIGGAILTDICYALVDPRVRFE